MESQISMFMVQSGPIRRSLVALSTRTVAEDEEDDDAIIIFLSLSKKLSPLENSSQTISRSADYRG